MKEGLRNFLLQWVLPAGIFSVILTFLFAGFSADIKREVTQSYEEDLYGITENYARQFNNAVKSTFSVGKTAVRFISDGDLSEEEIRNVLGAVLDNTDAYLAVLTDDKGQAISTAEEPVSLSDTPYFEHVAAETDFERFFVADDGITGTRAYVLSINVGSEKYAKLFIYYPLSGANTRKYAPVESEYDQMGYVMIIDGDGVVQSSTGSNESLVAGQNFWTDVILDISEATANRHKTKLESGSTGSLTGKISNRTFFITYTPIGNSDSAMVVCFAQSNVSKKESRMISMTLGRLIWCVVIIALFIVLVTALNVIRLYVMTKDTDALKEKADRDQLTGLKNKVTTETEIKDYLTEHPDTMAMLFVIDIDNFKKINDTMGHAFGDEVLRELGKNIGINFRVSDVIGRTGGDEFTIFLKNLKEDANCIREAQKLVYFFRHFQVGDYVKYSVTASIGAAVFPDHGTDFETLYKAADSAVYKAKKRGKNQLCFVDDRDKTPEEIAKADANQISLERTSE